MIKRNCILLFFILGCISSSFSQDFLNVKHKFPEINVIDTARYRIYYKHFMEDKNATRDKDINKETCLLVGDKVSLYKETAGCLLDSLNYSPELRNASITGMDFLNKCISLNAGPAPGLYRFHEENDSILEEGIHTNYFNYYRDAAPEIDWSIGEETKEIEGIPCRIATTRLHGRDWTAWFAESIPVFEGPWKLTGLPGLIIEAYDGNREHEFELISFSPCNVPIIDYVEKGDELTRKQMIKERIRDAKSKNVHLSQISPDSKPTGAEPVPFLNFIEKE